MVELGHEVWVVGPSVRSLVDLKGQYVYEAWPEVIPLSRDFEQNRGQGTRLWVTRGAAILRALGADLAIVHSMLPLGSGSRREVLVVHDWEAAGRGSAIARNLSRRLAYRRVDGRGRDLQRTRFMRGGLRCENIANTERDCCACRTSIAVFRALASVERLANQSWLPWSGPTAEGEWRASVRSARVGAATAVAARFFLPLVPLLLPLVPLAVSVA